MSIKKYIAELKRRHVFKAGVAYIVVAWMIVQVADIILPTFEAPPYVMKVLLFVLGIGFPVNLIFAWIYDITPDGIVKTENVASMPQRSVLKNNRLNRIIIGSLSIIIILLLAGLFTKNNLEESRNKTLIVSSEDPQKSIAVLAFADMSPKKDQEYFSDGISEELLNILAKIPELRVMSRTSSFSYKSKDVAIAQIGKELNVSHILEGSIRKSDSTLRITAQLINAADGSHLWSQTYDRKMDDIFKIQDEIAGNISNKLELTLLGKTTNNKAINVAAYDLYLKARHLVNQNTKESFIEAEKLIKHSIALDSTEAPAWNLLSSINYATSYNFLNKPLEEGIAEGLTAAKKAIKLDSTYALAYSDLGSLQFLQWNFEASDANFNKALELDPGNSQIIGTVALKKLGNLNESIGLIKKAILLDPKNYYHYYNLGYYYYLTNQPDAAEEAIQVFASHHPSSAIYNYLWSLIHIAQGNYKEALIKAEKEPDAFFNPYARYFALYSLGRVEEAEGLMNQLIATYGDTEAANIADMYAFQGDVENTFLWLNKALEIKDPVLLSVLSLPYFEKVYDDPRWNTLIAEMNLPASHGFHLN